MRLHPKYWLDRAALATLTAALNAAILLRLHRSPPEGISLVELTFTLRNLPLHELSVWFITNAGMVGGYLLLRWRFTRPLRAEIAVLGQQLQEVLHTARREITAQYHSVLTYAHYLDEQTHRRSADPQLRIDFDDVCESACSLKLIAGALEWLHRAPMPAHQPVPLAPLLQQTLLALVPSLERRAMQLGTSDVDETVIAASDPALLSHACWMLLLGLVRHAADESRLNIRCRYAPGSGRVQLGIVVNALAPGAITSEECAAHLMRQLQDGPSTLFAESIRTHGNLQLAELLLARLGGSVAVRPISAHGCEIRLELPAGAAQ